MKIRGKIYNKRSYQESLKQIHILFVEVDEAVQVNGEMIKLLPILSERSIIDFCIGEKIEADGDIQFEKIVTKIGKRSFQPIPVFQTNTTKKSI
jgi:hypothetical protein